MLSTAANYQEPQRKTTPNNELDEIQPISLVKSTVYSTEWSPTSHWCAIRTSASTSTYKVLVESNVCVKGCSDSS